MATAALNIWINYILIHDETASFMIAFIREHGSCRSTGLRTAGRSKDGYQPSRRRLQAAQMPAFITAVGGKDSKMIVDRNDH